MVSFPTSLQKYIYIYVSSIYVFGNLKQEGWTKSQAVYAACNFKLQMKKNAVNILIKRNSLTKIDSHLLFNNFMNHLKMNDQDN